MKFKKIMLVTLVLLAILTMGAVSASEDVASDDDGLAVIEEDASIDAPVEEVETDEVLSSPYEENGFDPIFENEVNLDSDKPVIDINTPDEGNFSISVDDGEETNVFNHEITEDDVETGCIRWTLDDLEITETGTYFITAKFISPSGDETTILDNEELMVFSDATDGVVIWVDEREFDLNNQEDLDAPFAYVSVSNEFLKSNVIRMWDEDQEDNGGCIFFEKSLSEITNYQPDNENEDFTVYLISLSNFEDRLDNLLSLKHLKIEFFDVDENDNYMEIDSRSYNVEYDDDESTVRFWEVADEDDDEDDAADGVVIWVDDEMEFDLNNQEDLNTPFAFVSVQNDLNGRIVFFIWNDEEDDDQELFGFDLEDITNNEDDPDNEGFTIYKISLNDLEGYEELIECGSFKLAFLDDDYEIDSHNYNIDYDDEEGIVTFWKSDDDEEDEMHGEGDEIEAEFTNANILDNGVVVSIPKDELPNDVDNEFTVIIPQEDDEPIEITLKLDEILEGDNYVIRVNDLQLPEFKEGYDILMILQFYTDGEKAYYAEWMDDDEPIHIFESPCIFNETSLLNDDDVITIQEIPEGVDEFTVIISKDGMDDIVKTFKFSELVEDEEDVWVALKLADLGITETGEYEITVKYSDDLTYSGDLIVTRDVDIRTHIFEEDGYLKTFESVHELVANLRISESVTGYVKLYVNGTQVGGNINFADLRLGTVPPDDGRQILLNDLNITESGMYKVKLEVYGDDDELLGETEFFIRVEVGENSANINEEAYPFGTEANDEIIEYIIGAPLSDGQYFNIYFNGIKAGVITTNGLEFNEEFTVPMFDVMLFKPGNYDVNVTFFDGETETDVTTGSFSINELNLTSDKAVYIFEEDHVIISFNADSLEDDDSVRAYYVYDWGPVGRHDSMIFNPYGGKEMKEDGLYKDGFVSFDVAWIEDEEGNEHFRLDEGTTLIYVVYRHGEERFGGFIEVNVVEESEEYIFMTSDSNVNPSFDVNTPSNVTGKVIIKNGEIIIKEINLDEIAEYDDEEERWHHDINVDWNDLDVGAYTITVVYEDGDGNVIQSKDFDIEIENWSPLGEPARIFIMWSDWPVFEKVEYDLNSTDMIHIYPNDDDSDLSDIRIVVKIGDKVYLDATLAELNLQAQINDHDELYYTIGPAHFTEDIAPGHYDNVIAYYYSPKYNIVGGEDGMPTYANLFGYSSVTFDDIEYTFGDEGSTTMVIDGATVSLENVTVDNHPEAQIALQDNVITVSGLAVGNYILKVVTTPINEYYRSVEASANITVKEKVVPPVVPIDPNLTIRVDDIREGTDAVITITTNSTFSGNVKVQIGTDNFTVPVTNGTGSYSVPGLAVGNHTAVATFEATETFDASTKNATFKVNKATVPDPETAISTDSGSTGPNPVYSINLGPDATGTFSVKIGDKVYTEELKGGAATIEVTDLPAGTYEAVISYSGDAIYAPISKTVNATVKAGTVIKATAVTTTYGTSKNIVITLTDADGKALAGKNVTVVLNGAKKVLTTDANGKASYAVGNKLAVKTYVASITFEGDASYVKSTGSAKVVVKKATPKLTAKKKTFKVKKAKKYSIVLKTDKGKALAKVKVTLTGKFKGKKIKITAKTNSKGKATFKLKKLTKKGKFTATVKFAGNKYYNAATKKAKIKIK